MVLCGVTFWCSLGVAHTGSVQPRQALVTLQPEALKLSGGRRVPCHTAHAINVLSLLLLLCLLLASVLYLLPLQDRGHALSLMSVI